MKGIVYKINKQRGMVVVLTGHENYSIFEMLGNDDFDIGDEVSWSKDNPLGDCDVKNISKNIIIEVYFQNHHLNRNNLEGQLLF
jgi:hypothetical protein